ENLVEASCLVPLVICLDDCRFPTRNRRTVMVGFKVTVFEHVIDGWFRDVPPSMTTITIDIMTG
nr:hypothetical protein [Tanacetum cinerariifolium]